MEAVYSRPMDARAEKIILDQVREGNDLLFEDLVRAHTPRLLNLAWRLVGDRATAEELTQEAFLRLHRTLSKFRGDSLIGTWLYRTVTHLAIDHLRREKLRRKIFFFRHDDQAPDPAEMVADPSPGPGDELEGEEVRLRLRQALKKLSPRQRAVFVLRHQEELLLKQIAAVLQLEEGTVKAHLHRAVTVLRRELHDLRKDSP